MNQLNALPNDAVATALALLKQAFVGKQAEPAKQAEVKEKVAGEANLEKIPKMSNPTDIPESSEQGASREGNGKVPYCYRCLTKGHTMDGCKIELYCDICDGHAHNTDRCPRYRAAKLFATPCGYAVDGLGFYYIPHTVTQKQKNESRTALVRVMEGTLTVDQMIAELTRLVSSKWQWKVQDNGNNTFRVMFPSMEELQHMIEWGIVHTKYNATMKIEERVVGHEVKYVMPKVWVQFTGLPIELREFEVIWAVGSILGVTKEVDMKFTRKYDRCRLQVLVLDPNLILQYVDVVIGDYLYELQFRVEEKTDNDNPEPMDMDNIGNNDGEE